ncbi:hypothetical protein NQ318_009764 [Aromia moschata]|uniref:FERM domain-containing protein n=1 Tax=Aromia moschata TaxID=1265417 RepID=A0AAV8Y8I4_9CUCU|nr:hypothetical protein NQ318_009764 [Aromia moschata]
MKTVVSKTGIEVLYPCTVHLLKNGEILECEYKSDHTGQDLLDYICQYQNLSDADLWGLRFVDIFDHRHWLELDQLIRPQVRNVCPIHFHFRMKVYPSEPHKVRDVESKHQLFMQLRYDLITGRLCCTPNESSLILALILQYTHGDFNPLVHFGNYIKNKVMLNQTFTVETKAIDIHKLHLNGLTKAQVEDLFLRMVCQLETYGVDPHLIEDVSKRKINLWINHKGLMSYFENKAEYQIKWMDIEKVSQEYNTLIVSVEGDKYVKFLCADEAECKYIYRSILDHLTYFTSSGRRSTVTLIGSEEEVEEKCNNEMLVANNTVGDSGQREFSEEILSDKPSDTGTLMNSSKKSAKLRLPFHWLSPKLYIVHVTIQYLLTLVMIMKNKMSNEEEALVIRRAWGFCKY